MLLHWHKLFENGYKSHDLWTVPSPPHLIYHAALQSAHIGPIRRRWMCVNRCKLWLKGLFKEKGTFQEKRIAAKQSITNPTSCSWDYLSSPKSYIIFSVSVCLVGQQAMVQDKLCVYVSKLIHIWAAGTFPRDEEPVEELCVFPPQGPSYQIKLGFCKTGETS